MRYPQLKVQATSRQMVDAFRGYNHNLRISSGEFFNMKNMTSDYYPVLSPRSKRGVYAKPASPQGLIAKDTICYVDGSEFVMGEYRIPMGLSTAAENCPKQLISMGAYVIVMPDKKYINTLDITDFGNIEAFYSSQGEVSFALCTVTGDVYTDTVISPDEPANPNNLDYWIDTSSVPHTLKQYSATSGAWVMIATTYVKISATGIGKAFEAYDGVTISGIKSTGLQDLNGNMVIQAKGDDYIVVIGILDTVTTQTSVVTVERRMPSVDFVIESGNRLWGCRYGTALNGDVVNEIYASKLGDFRNWNCFMGLSTDSYAASCGTDGPFTGAITHLGYPLFFKENCVHKVYGNYPANFQIQDTACRGVQKGCHASLAIVNETLFYKSRGGICAFDGSLPTEASYALGNEVYSDAVGGAHGNKYYVSMKDSLEVWHLFVFDTAKGMWHREDNLRASAFCSCRGEMYCIDAHDRNIITLLGSGDPYEDEVNWEVETGELGISSPDMKYISRLTIRMSMEIGAEMNIFAQYDMSDEWLHICNIRGTSLRSFAIPIRPRRCDYMKLRIVGSGTAKIYSWTKTIEQGSDVS